MRGEGGRGGVGTGRREFVNAERDCGNPPPPARPPPAPPGGRPFAPQAPRLGMGTGNGQAALGARTRGIGPETDAKVSSNL